MVLSPWPSGPVVFPKQEYLLARMKNILQIDVEDWYCDLDPQDWNKCEPRVVAATGKVLSMLRDSGNKATFFVLGYVAERFPDLVKSIEEQGHEVGTHGYGHRRIPDQTPEEFERGREKINSHFGEHHGQEDQGIQGPAIHRRQGDLVGA